MAHPHCLPPSCPCLVQYLPLVLANPEIWRGSLSGLHVLMLACTNLNPPPKKKKKGGERIQPIQTGKGEHMFHNNSSKIFSCVCASANTGPLCKKQFPKTLFLRVLVLCWGVGISKNNAEPGPNSLRKTHHTAAGMEGRFLLPPPRTTKLKQSSL